MNKTLKKLLKWKYYGYLGLIILLIDLLSYYNLIKQFTSLGVILLIISYILIILGLIRKR